MGKCRGEGGRTGTCGEICSRERDMGCNVAVVASEVRERSENVIMSDKGERIVRRKRTSRPKREDDLIIGAEEEGEKRGGEEECKWEESTPKTPSRQTSLE